MGLEAPGARNATRLCESTWGDWGHDIVQGEKLNNNSSRANGAATNDNGSQTSKRNEESCDRELSDWEVLLWVSPRAR